MLQQFGIPLRKSFFAQTRHYQGAKGAAVGNQRQTTSRSESLCQYAPRNVGAELLEVIASYENGLPCDECPACGRTLHRNREAFLKQTLADRKIQCVDLQTLGFSVIERKACVLVRHQATQGRRDGVEQFMQIENGNNRIIHFQQEAQPVSFFLELLLHGLCLLEVTGIVQRNRNLASYLLEKDHGHF